MGDDLLLFVPNPQPPLLSCGLMVVGGASDPGDVTSEQGPTAIMPGTSYTTIDHDDPDLRFLTDTCEDHLGTARQVEAKAAELERLAADGAFDAEVTSVFDTHDDATISREDVQQKLSDYSSGDLVPTSQMGRANSILLDGLGGDASLRQRCEAAAVERMGAALPRDPSDRAVFGRSGGEAAAHGDEDQFQVICKAGTIVVQHYDLFRARALGFRVALHAISNSNPCFSGLVSAQIGARRACRTASGAR